MHLPFPGDRALDGQRRPRVYTKAAHRRMTGFPGLSLLPAKLGRGLTNSVKAHSANEGAGGMVCLEAPPGVLRLQVSRGVTHTHTLLWNINKEL